MEKETLEFEINYKDKIILLSNVKSFVILIFCSMLLLTSCNPQPSVMESEACSKYSNISAKASEESTFTDEVSGFSSENGSGSTDTQTEKYNTAFITLYPDSAPTDKEIFM